MAKVSHPKMQNMALKVSISGALYSALLFEHATTTVDQDGFFLGEVSNCITDVISDSQIRGEKQETYLNIYEFVPCRTLFSFYNSGGEINQEFLHKILDGKQKDVIGWYKFRRNTTLQVSLRENALHSRLAESFVSLYDRHFLFGIFTSSCSPNHSTHSFDQVFFHYNGCSFQPLSLKIENLRDTDHTDYRMFPSSAVNINSGLFSEVLNSKEFSHGRDKEAENQARDMFFTLQKKLEDLGEKLATSEAILATTEMEVEELRNKVKEATGVISHVHNPSLEIRSNMADANFEGVSEDANVEGVSEDGDKLCLRT